MVAKLIWEKGRLYKNEDILVIQNVMVVPGGTKEAIIVVHPKRWKNAKNRNGYYTDQVDRWSAKM